MSHAQEIAILIQKNIIITLRGVILDAEKRIEKCRERIKELEAPTENGPYWVCSCGMNFYGWKGDNHKCPYCGSTDVKAVSQAIYEEVENG